MTDPIALSEQIGLTNIAPRVDLTGRVAVITGGADGIGKAVAQTYHRFGAHVMVIDVQEDKLKALEEELGDRVSVFPFDLRSENVADYQKLAADIEAASPTGFIDIYLINAGVIKFSNEKTIAQTPLGEYSTLARINLISHVALYQQLRPLLEQSDAGRILLTSSPIVGRKDPASACYAWTKKALEDNVAMFRQEIREAGLDNIMVAGYVPPPVQNWLRAHWKNEPLYANPMPEDVTELPLRLAAPALLPEFDGKMLTYVDKRDKGITAQSGAYTYDANHRTENGFDLGINIRDIGEGGGTGGDVFEASYDTWNARQLLAMTPVPPLDENIRLQDVNKPPAFIGDALTPKP